MSPKNVLIHQKQASKKKFEVDRSPPAYAHFGAIFFKLSSGGLLTGPLWEAPQGYFCVLPHPPRAQNRGTDVLKPRGHFDTPQCKDASKQDMLS